jgi:hypothetical protein
MEYNIYTGNPRSKKQAKQKTASLTDRLAEINVTHNKKYT